MSLDRRCRVTLEPRAPPAEHLREEPSDGVGVGHSEARGGRARSDLHADVGPGEHRERVLVREVVADEKCPFRSDLLPDAGEGRPLVGVDE